MTTINGTVRYLKRVQQAQFEPAEAEISISFFTENEEEIAGLVDRAQSVVHRKVFELLGLKPPVKLVEVASTATSAVEKAIEADAAKKGEVVEETVTKPRRIPAAKKPQAAPVDEIVEEVKPTAQVPEEIVPDGSAEDGELVEENFDAPTARIIPDNELTNVTTTHNKTVQNTPAIKALVAEFAPRLSEIPQARRQEYLDRVVKIGKMDHAV